MSELPIQIVFPEVSPSRAEDLSRRMEQLLGEALPEGVSVARTRSSPDSMNEGEIVSVIFGAMADNTIHHLAVFTGTVAGTALFKAVEHFAERHHVIVRITSIFWPEKKDVVPQSDKTDGEKQ